MKERSDGVAGDQEAALDELEAPVERVILVLDRDDAVVADAVQLRDEPVTADLPETGQARDLPAHPE